ncbi:MAG: hypothetical protein Q7S12_03945 [bacterium]|nr:hypothetical protein [bacterium]
MRVNKSAKIILPDGNEIKVYIWKDEGKITSSIQVLSKDASVHLGENAIGMTWGKGERNSEVRFEEARVPRHAEGMYFGKGKLSYVKRFKRKGKSKKI